MEYYLTSHCGKENITKRRNSVVFYHPVNNETHSCPYLVVIPSGNYIFECWGASGQSGSLGRGGLGAYTYGEINISTTTSFYLFIGPTKFDEQGDYELFNGGGSGDRFGGGATDIRLLYFGLWSTFESLKSRIMVAGGGGGYDGSSGGTGGNAGGLIGGMSYDPYYSGIYTGYGGIQSSGGSGFVSGSFGRGGSSVLYNSSTGIKLDNGGGGGGGYYGGGTGGLRQCCSGGGGSSFISGHEGCDAINETSTSWKIIHTGQNEHYSGYKFHNTTMISGNNSMPLPSGDEGIGYIGCGSIRISAIEKSLFHISSCRKSIYIYHSSNLFLVLTSFYLLLFISEQN